jgi:hypothetical protein
MVKETIASLKRSLQAATEEIDSLKADLSERDSNIIALEIELDGKVK